MSDATPVTEPSEPRHRATSSRSRAVVIIAVIAVLALLAVGGAVLFTGDDPQPAAAPPPSTTAVAPTPTPTITPTPTPTKTTPTKPPIPHEVVKASGPKTFLFQGPHFSIKAHVCGMADLRPLDPPGEQEHTVCWVEEDDGFGGNAPSHDSGTTYVLGHSWAENPQEVLNRISEPATKEILNAKPKYVSGIATYPVTSLNGSTLTLWTPTAKLVYKVRNVYGVAKSQAGYVKPLMDSSIKKRVVIITCAERNGADYDYNVVVNAYLYSSQKRSPSA